MGYYKHITLCLAFIQLLIMEIGAQRKLKADTLEVFREYVHVSNSYKKLPLYLDLEIKNSANFITGSEDTSTLYAEFYLQNDHSYVRIGEFEQVVNDSMALLVSDKLKQMILFPDASSIVNTMKVMLGASLPDSSILDLSKRYQCVTKSSQADIKILELISRSTIHSTLYPKETIELTYSPKTRNPIQVLMIKRSLVPLNQDEFIKMQGDVVASNPLIVIEERPFLLKEQKALYVFRNIEKSDRRKIPVEIKDRIVFTSDGIRPVKHYEHYGLTQN